MLDVYIQRGMPRVYEVTFHVKTDSIITEEDARGIQAWHGLPVPRAGLFSFRLIGKKLLKPDLFTTDDRILREYEWHCVDTLGDPHAGDLE